MHLLDTNILTAMHTGHPKVTKALSLLDDPEIATTIVNRVELLQVDSIFC
jgi:predicted nucleic acid-binding protein